MKGFIYKVTNTLNGKIYIGQTIQSVKARWYRHCGKSGISDAEMNTHFKRAILKYGKNSFKVETIEEVDSSQLNDREIYWIRFYDSYNSGYNSTPGGNLGFKPFKLDGYKDEIIELYQYGFSIRAIAKEFNVDKATIKNLLVRYNIPIRKTRTYKYSQIDRESIMKDFNSGMKRSAIIMKYKISHSYLSQLISGDRRI